MERKLVAALFAVLFFMVVNSVYDAYKAEVSETDLTQKDTYPSIEAKPQGKEENLNDYEKVVYIEGAVAKQGLVYLNGDARIGEVVEMAGGLLANADVKNLNMADKAIDGQKITVPFKSDNEDFSANSSESSNKNSDLININTTTAEELQKLSGVGPATAKKIIEYREKHGAFKTIEEIKKVRGIGDKTFEKFKDKIKV